MEVPPQSPLGEQIKLMFLGMLPDNDFNAPQETFDIEDLQPKAILVDDYEINNERP